MEGPREAQWAWSASASSDTKTNDGNRRSELFEKSRENAKLDDAPYRMLTVRFNLV